MIGTSSSGTASAKKTHQNDAHAQREVHPEQRQLGANPRRLGIDRRQHQVQGQPARRARASNQPADADVVIDQLSTG
jgi:hypothetical protein